MMVLKSIERSVLSDHAAAVCNADPSLFALMLLLIRGYCVKVDLKLHFWSFFQCESFSQPADFGELSSM